jgi:DNA-binding response OmpR family regulator
MNVLLVEDDVGIGRFVSQGLAARGLSVRWERSGHEVAGLAASGDINLVILDLGLPDTEGLDLCAAIRAMELGIPVLMLTARGSLDDRLDGFAVGADDYLAKPFAFEELAARVDVLLRRDRERKPDPVRFHALRLDPAAQSATWDGKAIDLDPRSFALLLALAKSRGETVPRQTLIETIWGKDADITDNALDVCTSALRRRLGTSAPRLHVFALRGQGFALGLKDEADLQPT